MIFWLQCQIQVRERDLKAFNQESVATKGKTSGG